MDDGRMDDALLGEEHVLSACTTDEVGRYVLGCVCGFEVRSPLLREVIQVGELHVPHGTENLFGVSL
jgi:hypothetical protein